MAPNSVSKVMLTWLATAACGANAQVFDPYALFEDVVSEGTLIAAANDTHFADVASSRWSAWEAPGYMAAIKPVTEADVQAIVSLTLFFFHTHTTVGNMGGGKNMI